MGNIGAGEEKKRMDEMRGIIEETVKKVLEEALPALADEVAKAAMRKLKDKFHLALNGSKMLRLAAEEDLRGELQRREQAELDDTEFLITIRGGGEGSGEGREKRKRKSRNWNGEEGPAEKKRVDEDGKAYYKWEFVKFHGGTEEWERAEEEKEGDTEDEEEQSGEEEDDGGEWAGVVEEESDEEIKKGKKATKNIERMEAHVSDNERRRLMKLNEHLCEDWLKPEGCCREDCERDHYMRRES